MAYRFDVVAFRVNDEGSIVMRVIVWPKTWGAIIFAASGDGCMVESVHLGAGFCPPGQMTTRSGRRPSVG